MAKSKVLVDEFGNSLEIPEPRKEEHLMEFFAWETVGISPYMVTYPLEVQDVEGNRAMIDSLGNALAMLPTLEED